MNAPLLRFEPEAVAELQEAAEWYDSRGAGLGHDFLDAVDVVLERVVRWPASASVVPGVRPQLGVRRAPVPRFPYHVVYIPLPGQIRVLAVAHDRRRPKYWHTRVGSDEP